MGGARGSGGLAEAMKGPGEVGGVVGAAGAGYAEGVLAGIGVEEVH